MKLQKLKKTGGFIPGIRPGERTAFFINDLLIKLTTIGSTYLVIICLMPSFNSKLSNTFLFRWNIFINCSGCWYGYH